MLGVRDILRRVAACYLDPASALCALAQTIIRQAAHREPQASLLYLEASEDGNPRSSFDINLYKAGMQVADASVALAAAAAALRIPAAALDAQLEMLGTCPLGHLSSGIDRHGQEFISVYAETLRA
jgi:hypothetical protein